MIHTVGSTPHFLQELETFPSDQLRMFSSNVARGAGIVLCPTGASASREGGGGAPGGPGKGARGSAPGVGGQHWMHWQH